MAAVVDAVREHGGHRPATGRPRKLGPHPYRARRGGFTLIELILVLALAAGLATALMVGLRSLARSSLLETARLRTELALLEARRLAYLSAQAAELGVEPAAEQLLLREDGQPPVRIKLPAGVYLSHVPRRRRVRFFPSGLAENATITLALTGAAAGSELSVVVNQRGMIH